MSRVNAEKEISSFGVGVFETGQENLSDTSAAELMRATMTRLQMVNSLASNCSRKVPRLPFDSYDEDRRMHTGRSAEAFEESRCEVFAIGATQFLLICQTCASTAALST